MYIPFDSRRHGSRGRARLILVVEDQPPVVGDAAVGFEVGADRAGVARLVAGARAVRAGRAAAGPTVRSRRLTFASVPRRRGTRPTKPAPARVLSRSSRSASRSAAT